MGRIHGWRGGFFTAGLVATTAVCAQPQERLPKVEIDMQSTAISRNDVMRAVEVFARSCNPLNRYWSDISGRIAGHTLFYDLGGGLSPGMMAGKRPAQLLCGL